MSRVEDNKIKHIANEIAIKLNLPLNFLLDSESNVENCDGFSSEVYKLGILDSSNPNNHKTYRLLIKKAPTDKTKRNANNIEFAYKNEIHFYTQVIPTLKEFERAHQVTDPFDLIPEYMASIVEPYEETIVLKNATSTGFETRSGLLDREHVKLIFQTYARFHALSFCLKDQKPEEFLKLIEPLNNIFEKQAKKPDIMKKFEEATKRVLYCLVSTKDEVVFNKFWKYADETEAMFSKSIKYEGKYSTILHGDCSQSNLLFKYSEAKPEALKLLDFQMVMVGTPVYDLSFIFYSGGSRELFDELELYLDIYHESFTNFSKKLGSDPENLLPREVLSEDWKQYARFGMLMSIKYIDGSLKQELFSEKVRDILTHLSDIDAL